MARPEDLVRLYDIILQNYADLKGIVSIEKEGEFYKSIDGNTLFYRALRCFYIAECHLGQSNWINAIVLYDKCKEHVSEALASTANNMEVQGELNTLSKQIYSQRCSAHASAFLHSQEEAEELEDMKPANKNRLLKDCLDEFRLFETADELPTIYTFPPDFQTIPCKPIFFDISLNHIGFPDLSARVEKEGGALSGLSRWIWGPHMSINTAANGPGRLLLMSGERVVSRNKSVEFSLDGNNLPPKLLKKETGEVYLTDRRTIFLCSDSKNLHSFSADFGSLSNVNLEQPLFGANFVKAIVRAEPGGGWDGTAKMKLIFSAGGAIEFGKHLLHMQQGTSFGYEVTPTGALARWGTRAVGHSRGGGPPMELPPTYDSFDYNPYGPPPAPYYNQGYPAGPPAPGYYPPPPPGYSAGPSGYAAPPTYVYDSGPPAGSAGPSSSAPPYNPSFPENNAAASQVMYSGHTAYTNQQPDETCFTNIRHLALPQYDSGPPAGSAGPSSSAPPYNPSFPENNAAASQVMYSGHTAYTNQQPGPSSGAHPPPLPPDYDYQQALTLLQFKVSIYDLYTIFYPTTSLLCQANALTTVLVRSALKETIMGQANALTYPTSPDKSLWGYHPIIYVPNSPQQNENRQIKYASFKSSQKVNNTSL
eukprot:sb/3462870/